MKKTLFIIALIIATFVLIIFFRGSKYPTRQEVLPEVLNSPEQVKVAESPFVLQYQGFSYELTPKYSYELYGMVLSYHHSDSWIDISHKNDPYNTKDICTMWGQDLDIGIYEKMKFTHGDWTCYANFKSSAKSTDYNKFQADEMSNNHLIPASDDLNNLMRKAKNGDQVYFKGYLVDYKVTDSDGNNMGSRQTSTIREDSKCEVVYVADFKILKKYTILDRFKSGLGLD
ncbi:MAG: hypothetical protein WCV58_00825 [Patescibacteria group bacterium]|jgi:hypothetical protein